MRGKAAPDVRSRSAGRITPAHAGKRLSRSDTCRAPGDHPRTCGEKSAGFGLRDLDSGSPPHMRGKVRILISCDNSQGITPAHAGKREAHAGSAGGRRDHPRTCGEKQLLLLLLKLRVGSPPHMRGKAHTFRTRTNWQGITPAHAGKRIAIPTEPVTF